VRPETELLPAWGTKLSGDEDSLCYYLRFVKKRRVCRPGRAAYLGKFSRGTDRLKALCCFRKKEEGHLRGGERG